MSGFATSVSGVNSRAVFRGDVGSELDNEYAVSAETESLLQRVLANGLSSAQYSSANTPIKVGVVQSSTGRVVSGSASVKQTLYTPSAVYPAGSIVRLTPQFAALPIGADVVQSSNGTKASLAAGGEAGGAFYRYALYPAVGGIGCWACNVTGTGEVVVGVGSGYTDVTAEPGVEDNEGFSVNLETGAVFNNGTLVATLTPGTVASISFRVEQTATNMLSVRFQVGTTPYGPYAWTFTGPIWCPIVWLSEEGVTVELNDGTN